MIDLSKLWPHQIETYEFGKDRNAVFCTSSPGVGKSLPHAKIAENAIKNQNCTRVLVVCPKTLMRTTWFEEFTNYTTLDIALAEAPENTRLAAFESNSPVVIINTDGVVWLLKQNVRWLKRVLGSNPLLIVDESSTFKNPNAKRTKAYLKLSALFSRVFSLAGTPAPNSVTELWSQVYALDKGVRLGNRYTRFRNIMQYPINKGAFVNWADKPEASETVYGLIRDLIIHHEFDDVMTQVPELQHRVMYYTLSSKHMDFYKSMEEEAYIKVKNKHISAINAGSLANKLLQIASGAVYNDGTDHEWSLLDTGRYELIADLVQEHQHSCVFFHWLHQRKVLQEEFNKRGITYDVIDGTVKSTIARAEIISRFQNGELDTVLLQPLSAAHGVTLTQADTIIWASPTYQGDIYKQGIARIRRGVQRKHTQSIVILGKNTRDQHCYEVFSGKQDRIEALNNLFKGEYESRS
jgi:SNF2 family DNA or RNA helicase